MKSIVYLLTFSLFIISCGSKTTTQKKTEELSKLKKERSELDVKIAKLELEVNKDKPVKAAAVSIMTVQPQSFNAFIQVQAQVTGDENVLATPQAGGVVKSVLVHSGQRVGKGQTLAVLDASAIEQQIKLYEAQLSLAKQVYEKQQKLWAQNIGSQVQLLQAKTNYEAALSQKQGSIAQRNMYTIKSPISGVVDEVSLKEGDAAMPGVSGIRVVSKDKLKAKASLGEMYLGKVKAGDPVTLVFPESNDSFRTKLSYVAQSIDPISRAFNVEVKLPSMAQLHPNMSCRMKIANYENSNALVIPVSVIQKNGDNETVYIAENNKAKAVPVVTGKTSNGLVEILGGLKAGDKIIVTGYQDIDNGEPIAIQ
jgi:membrane fusion protein, multidrug efflux system